MSTQNPPPLSIRIEGAIYETALGLTGEEREAFLERTFQGDPDGLAAMREMLEKTGDSSTFFLEAREHRSFLAGDLLEKIPPESLPDDGIPQVVEEPGTLIGPYRLLSRIGEGGCGVIYEAEQEEPVCRRVALKIIRLGMDTESVVARFKAERQALALMDHPNIARVFDAGATASGRPYFVMERVSGERITACCDHERLDIVARIRLFIQVCHAIQHAHQKGIIHRDIKPSNILVAFHNGIPTPKVIDFGIAKAVSGGSPGESPTRTLRTSRDEWIGTPAYMSPEQVEMGGLDVDTRSDIYSLGALLHELLAGRPPFDGEALASAGISRMRRTLLECEPPLPSRMLAGLPPGELAEIAEARREEPGRLIARLRGDLDRIVAKAMEKDRNRRYQTANALAVDLHRYLANEPVTARPSGRLYLLGKFVRRNRAACISGAAVAISLVAGLGASTWLYFEEREARAEQERLSVEAEAARANEARLRAQAQARANVAEAAAALAEGRIEEADALLKKSPVDAVDPSLEAAGVFRALGHWNATYGRWPEARQCYILLNQANQLDNPVRIAEGSDLLTIGPALLEAGDREGYERIRLEFLDRHLPAQNPLQAEHIIKASLLTPAGPEILERLRSSAEVCAQGAEERADGVPPPIWETLSMTFFHHRSGDPAQTLVWGSKCLAYPDPAGPRAAAALCMLAMAHHRAGNLEKAAQDLRAARLLLVDPPKGEPPPGAPPRGSWISWSIARFLEAEATAEIEGTAHWLNRTAGWR
jgi:Serine/threonine protein kinase